MTYLKFNNKFYEQKSGLPIGKPISGVPACLFLEPSPFKYIFPIKGIYFWYINDIRIFLLLNIKIEKTAEKEDNTEPSININYEKDSNNNLPFPDILIIKSQNMLTFKVYRKHMYKNNYIHFCSHHNNKIKSGPIIGFYLQTLRTFCLQ